MSALSTGLVEALLDSLWQAPVIAVLTWLLEVAWARRSSTRVAIRTAGLLATLGLVVLTVLGTFAGSGPSGIVTGGLDGIRGAAALAASTSSPWWVDVAMGVWLVGVAGMTARVAASWRRVDRLRRGAWPVPEVWRQRVEDLAVQLEVRMPQVGLSPECESPLLLGVLRPMVLLPVGLINSVSPAVVEAALAHELVHLRRLDPWLHAAQTITEVLLFFNPTVWWLSWRTSIEREHACDEAVLQALHCPALPYAQALVELEQWRHRPVPALTLGALGGGLAARIRRLVQPRAVRPVHRWTARVGLLGFVAIAAVALGWALTPTSPSGAYGATPLWLPSSVSRHDEAITEAAARHGVDPSLLAIMVWAESRGRPDARSPVGARGLMQLMPATAEEIAERRGLPGHTDAKLDEPAYNLDLGAWYLARQIEHYGELPLAVAAYNAGPGRVSAYERGEVGLPEETERYQATVMALWAERWWLWSPTLAAHR